MPEEGAEVERAAENEDMPAAQAVSSSPPRRRDAKTTSHQESHTEVATRLAQPGSESAASVAPRWWENKKQFPTHWCGVFKGGGAKGLAYVGALEAVADRHVWFSSVTGSSAGALTATLVAAGVEPAHLRQVSAEMLSRVQRSLLGPFLGGAWPLYSLGPVAAWLRPILAEQTAKFGFEVDDGLAVTFALLYQATGIELNIVVMDLATSQPVVLNHISSPECSVVAAAMASSSIPVVFPSGRLMMLTGGGEFVVHRVVDGGAWANYPRFVYGDASFRAYHGLGPLEANNQVVGFVLESGPVGMNLRPWQFRQDLQTDEDRDYGLFLASKWPGRLLRRLDKTGWRLMTLVVWPVLSTLVTVQWLVQERTWWQPLAASWGSWFSLGRFAIVAALALAALMSLGLALLAFAFGREIIRVGIATVKATTSVSTGVPYWLGAHEREPVIRVPVPAGVSTTSFRLKREVRETAMDRAKEATYGQVDLVLAGQPTRGIQAPATEFDVQPPPIDQIQVQSHNLAQRFVVIVGLIWLFIFAGARLSGAVVNLVVDGVYPPPSAWLTLAIVSLVPLLMFSFYARGSTKRAATRATMLRKAAARHAKGEPYLAGEEPLTRRRAKRRAITYSFLAGGALCATVWAVGTMGSTNQAGIIYDGKVQQVQLEGGREYEHVVLINEGPYAGQRISIYSPPHTGEGQHVKVRIVESGDRARAEWATDTASGMAFAGLFLLFWVAAWGAGAVWNWLDYAELRRLGMESQLEMVQLL